MPSNRITSGTLIVGLGSPHGDDQFGWRVAQQLASLVTAPGTEVRIARSPADLLDWLDGAGRLIVCDACEWRAKAGTLHVLRWPSAELSCVRFSGSHDLGLTSALALAGELGRLPAAATLVAVEQRRHAVAAEMSAEVAGAVPRAVEWILRAVANDRV